MRILDLYCGAGGAAAGYHRAGFEVCGIDIEPQPNYYAFDFAQRDALEALTDRDMLSGFDAIHASPPCQWSSALSRGTNAARRGQHINLIPATRELLKLTGLPYIIENVQGSDLRRDLTLCGEMFGLDVIRHRYFEVSGFDVQQPQHIKHRGRVAGWRHGVFYDGPYFAVYGDGGGKGLLDQWRAAMDVPWMQTRHEISESIPPAFSEYVGMQLMDSMRLQAAS